MGFKLLDFYKISPPVSGGETDSERSVRFKRIRWATCHYRIWHLLCLSFEYECNP